MSAAFDCEVKKIEAIHIESSHISATGMHDVLKHLMLHPVFLIADSQGDP
jgi:hypothetical protein